jgi:hypothetical protein
VQFGATRKPEHLGLLADIERGGYLAA